jgi:hypothetical protein
MNTADESNNSASPTKSFIKQPKAFQLATPLETDEVNELALNQQLKHPTALEKNSFIEHSKLLVK